MKKLILLLNLLFATAFLIGCTADADVVTQDRQVPIRLATSEYETVSDTYVAIGEVKPEEQLDVFLTQPGNVETIMVKQGDYITVDGPLLLLEDASVESALDTTESQLRTVRDNLSVSYQAALKSFNQQKTLLESGATTQNAYDLAYDQLITLQRQYADARNRYTIEVENLEGRVDDLAINSPINGQIAEVYIKEGDASQQQRAFTIVNNTVLHVSTMVSSDLIRLINLDDEVVINTDFDTSVIGVVRKISTLPDPQSKLYEVEITLPDNSDVSIGDFAEVIYTTTSYEAIVVPANAIVRKGISQYIWVYKENELVKQIVEVGLSKGDWIEIKNINEPIEIIVSGQNIINESDAFIIVD
jgi:RND family efflux transporter MFP subunit